MLLEERDCVGRGVCGQEALPGLGVAVDERGGARASQMLPERVAMTGRESVVTRGWGKVRLIRAPHWLVVGNAGLGWGG